MTTPRRNTVSLPRITIVTPSFNQAAYLEATIRSVLDQNYPNLEYIIIDGGSTDGSVDIIREYQNRLAYWTSEADDGQYHAINKGFSVSTGEILGWINSDDFLLPNALSTIAGQFQSLPEVEWLTSRTIVTCDEWGVMSCYGVAGASRQGWSETCQRTFIQQESTFWTRDLFDRACGLQIPTTHSHAADQELWLEFFSCADLYLTEVPLACARQREGQRWREPQFGEQSDSVRQLANDRWGRSITGRLRQFIYHLGLNRIPIVRGIARRALGYSIPVIRRPNLDPKGLITDDKWMVSHERRFW